LKKNKISKNWINKQRRDVYVKRSKIEGYRSRAVYKLEEINNKFNIFKNGASLIDLGAAPGSWSQLAEKKIQNSKILSIDLKEMVKIGKVEHIVGDFKEDKNKKKIKDYFGKKVDIVLSDMAVNTTGNKSLDSILTCELAIEAMNFSKEILKNNGKFVSKIFMGSSFNEVLILGRKIFKKINVYKPPSSRKDSKENFIICQILR
tara:strand:+ start:3128 stop:3739 length:612 start_codon:yes stop_codon:yes gene_type:complete